MSAARLLILDRRAGQPAEVLLGHQTRLGRAAENDVVLDAPEVSRRHALVRCTEDEEYVLIDLGSANGTDVNGQRLAFPVVLSAGDRISIGPFEMTVAIDQPRAADKAGADAGKAGITRVVRDLRDAAAPQRLIGTGAAMAEVFRLVDRAAAASMPVLLVGETGTGKELVARAIHRAGARADKPFLVIACAQMSGDGAAEELRDRLADAAGGSVLLDDIAELPSAVQGFLLPLFETSTEPDPVLRFMASMSGDAEAVLAAGRLRKDLYYRLAAFTLRLPPLRERREDIELLAAQMIAAAAHPRGKAITGIDADALAALGASEWPGNLRELRNQIERAVLLARDGDRIGLRHLTLRAQERSPEESGRVAPRPGDSGESTERVTEGPHLGDAHRSSPQEQNVFRKEGEFWTVRYAGRQAHLKDSKGMHFIARLLGAAGSELHARDLAAELSGELDEPSPLAAGVATSSDAIGSTLGELGPALDARAKAEYRRRLAELREDLAEAEANNDSGRTIRARTEIELLTLQISAAVGMGGRDRPRGSHDERARLLVTQRVKATLKKIAETHPELGEHLSARIRTGYRCFYALDPAERIDWLT